MNSFQPISIDKLEINPFEKIGKEWALVTAGAEEKVNTMTVSWGGLGVMWGKNVAFIFIRDSRYTKEFIDNEETFSVTFFDEQYKKALGYCGSHTGRNEDKLTNAGLTLACKDNIPYIAEGNLVFLCKKMSATRITKESFLTPKIEEQWYQDGDMHTMYIAEIIEVIGR